MGIPLINIENKEAFEKFATHMSEKFAVKKSWLLDIQSVNLSEIFGATLGVVALMFGWKDHEKEEFANLGDAAPVNQRHPYHLNSFWVNYQKQTEFNPLHDHGGVYSFVIWMKIPTKHSEQNQNPIAANSLSPHISNFEFVYKDINGKNQEFIYQMSPDLEGTMLFFPSTLQHIVYPFFNCDEQRISISGNVTIDTSVIL